VVHVTTTGRQALEYAEQQVGVHKVWEEAQVHAAYLSELRTQLAHMRHAKAVHEDAYQTAEYEFITDTRAQLAEMSQTAFDKAIKAAVHKEPSLRSMRADLARESLNIELTEANVARARVDIEIATARLTELGGYFAYLAAIKEAETRMKYPPATAVQIPSVEDWPPASAVAGTATPTTPATPAI
jgi:hypothetical protein